MMQAINTTFSTHELPVQVLAEYRFHHWEFEGVLRQDGKPLAPRTLRLLMNSVKFMKHVDALIENMEDPYADR